MLEILYFMDWNQMERSSRVQDRHVPALRRMNETRWEEREGGRRESRVRLGLVSIGAWVSMGEERGWLGKWGRRLRKHEGSGRVNRVMVGQGRAEEGRGRKRFKTQEESGGDGKRPRDTNTHLSRRSNDALKTPTSHTDLLAPRKNWSCTQPPSKPPGTPRNSPVSSTQGNGEKVRVIPASTTS
ncbi:hypothetical protein E2C01_085684 [Portunus trituberculatus]|uniref:Uncharacterized protein n=1 Tax=Portunus trituberculatus TaxID=210409 RepID=A0A5B7JBC6_PORTR|nr:hypothetical protein [Portunus trituberculatus]